MITLRKSVNYIKRQTEHHGTFFSSSYKRPMPLVLSATGTPFSLLQLSFFLVEALSLGHSRLSKLRSYCSNLSVSFSESVKVVHRVVLKPQHCREQRIQNSNRILNYTQLLDLWVQELVWLLQSSAFSIPLHVLEGESR